jgi:hypothetical protein
MNLNLNQMSREEKLRAMHEIWEDLAQDDQHLESPAWHHEALAEAAKKVASGAEGIRDWAEAKEELRRRIQ